MMYLLMVAVMLVMWQLALEVGFGIFRLTRDDPPFAKETLKDRSSAVLLPAAALWFCVSWIVDGLGWHELHVMGIFYGLGFILIECWMLYCIRSDPAYR